MPIFCRHVQDLKKGKFMTKILSQQGEQLRAYFLPEGDFEVITPLPEIDQLRRGVQQGIRYLLRELVENNHGRISFYGETANTFRQAGLVVASLLQTPDSITIPHLKTEREALGRLLAESSLEHGREILCIAPVCPDYTDSRMLQEGVSREAEAGGRGMKATIKAFTKAGYKPRGIILIADTEDDLEDVIQRSVEGDRAFYKSQCEASVEAVRRQLDKAEGIEVMTFSAFFGSTFRERQYMYEKAIRQNMGKSSSLRRKIESIGEVRRGRHGNILGREERAYELTIRYAAQYAALGDLVRETPIPTIVLNYETPNRVFINPHRADSVFPQVRTVPVLGTKVRRKK